MILLHAFCIFAIALPCFSAPDLSQAVARISEARARAAANRQRIKDHSARISSHIRSPISRQKRQYATEYETPPPLPPPPPGYKPEEYEEPELIHICSVEDSYEGRSAENSEEEERTSFEESSNLEKTLDLQNFDGQRPNFKALDQSSDNLNSTRFYVDHEDGETLKDAEPHLHTHFRPHIRDHLPILPSQVISHGLHHLPTSHAIPGLHLNINQNAHQNAHGWQHQLHGLNHQVLPTSSIVNQGILPTQNVISTQTQPLLHRSASFVPFSQTRPVSTQMTHSTFLPGGNILTPTPINQGTGSLHGSFLSGSRLRAEFEGNQPDDVIELGEESSREAKPTLKKLKRKKLQYYSQYPPVYSKHGQYRENDSEEDEDDDEEERVASPTHKLIKKKKMMKMQPYYPPYQAYPQHYQPSYGYRVADEDAAEELMERKAKPTIKKLKRKKMQKFYPQYSPQSHYGGYRNAEENEEFSTEEEEKEARSLGKLRDTEDFFLRDEETLKMKRKDQQNRKDDDSEDFSSAQLRTVEDPTLNVAQGYIISAPYRRKINDQYKRSLKQQLDTILGEQRKLVDDLEKQSKDDEDLKLIADISNRSLATVEEKRIAKRSLPLTRLIVDPKAKLDVPKTIENFGTATRNAFEDERAPMYHFKHLMGSSRNAFLSAMRIPPQNMIIPTDYEIVKSSEVRRSGPEEDPDNSFSQTFRKVGEMVREGIKSGQETAYHLGEAAHSARNVLHSARHSAPRLIIPYSQIPALQKTHKPKKAVLITPRILDVAHEQILGRPSDSKPHFVKLGHLMDAVGISNPEAKSLDLEKIVFEPRSVSAAKLDRLQLPKMRKIDVDEALSALENAKLSVGAKNLKDFLVKMKHELTNFIKHVPLEEQKTKKKRKKHHEIKEMGKFIDNLFDQNEADEVVGDGLHLAPELLHPFMGRATTKDLKSFLRENGDEDFDKKNLKKNNLKGNDSNLGYVLGAINPLMFERMYNETVEVKKEESEEMGRNDTVGTVMTLTQPMMRPFMGQAGPQQVEDLLDTYNEDVDSEDYNEMNE